jgi:hypothetical protein
MSRHPGYTLRIYVVPGIFVLMVSSRELTGSHFTDTSTGAKRLHGKDSALIQGMMDRDLGTNVNARLVRNSDISRSLLNGPLAQVSDDLEGYFMRQRSA